jgi:hypothetical protein
MSKSTKSGSKREVLTEYGFTGAVRGKYAQRFAAGSNVVVLDPDVAEAFADPKDVNELLRYVVKLRLRQLRRERQG